MSSFDEDEDERFLQLLHEYFLESPPFLLVPSSSPPLHHNPAFISLQNILEERLEYETKILEKVLLYMNEKGHTKNIKEFIVLRLKMDNYESSICKTSWISTFGSPKVYEYTGVYEYIDIMLMIKDNDVGTPKRVIIDLDFKSQFELARPTDSYRELIDALPCIFVGSEEKLNKIISLLCTAAKQSLKKRGLHVPPWRKFSYMQSKWLSENCNKNSFCT